MLEDLKKVDDEFLRYLEKAIAQEINRRYEELSEQEIKKIIKKIGI